MIPESFIQELLSRVDIVDVIERYVPLKKGGANYQACCPFHSEKTPSFTVSPAKQFYHCFGCGKNGNAIGFLMDYAGMNFVEAVKDLAGQYGMQVPEDDASPAGTMCWITGAAAGANSNANDVDGGVTTLTSPLFSAIPPPATHVVEVGEFLVSGGDRRIECRRMEWPEFRARWRVGPQLLRHTLEVRA